MIRRLDAVLEPTKRSVLDTRKVLDDAHVLDYEWLIIDASRCKVYPHAAEAKGNNQEMTAQKGAQHQDPSGRGCAWFAA